MSISSTVAALARALATHLRSGPHDAALLGQLDQIAEMPAFVAKQRLDQWEAALLPMRSDKQRLASDPAYAAAIAILELGRSNMYAAIEPEIGEEHFARAIEALARAGVAGIPARATVDLTDW